jgi:hypothetical protein
MLTITLSTYKISFCGRKRGGIEEVRGEARAKNVSKQELTSEGKPELRIYTTKYKFNVLDTILNELVHDLAEPEFEEGN